MASPVYGISAFAAVVLIAAGSVPGAENVASCNAEARDALKAGRSGGVTPITKDRERADAARRGDAKRPDDSQLAGMDPDGAKNPAYQAAYRTCMRRSGF